MTRSPSIRHAVWPGATPNAGSARSSESSSWRPAATGSAVQSIARERYRSLTRSTLPPGRCSVAPRTRTRAVDHTVGLGVGLQHVQRLRRADADPAPLADGEVVMAVVTADDGAVAVDQVAGPVAEAAVARQEGALSLAGQEAEAL